MSGNSKVRGAKAADRDAFLAMWEDFVSLDPNEPGDRGMGELNWSRSMDAGQPLKCLVCVDETGVPCGFTLYLAFSFTWSVGDVCYLEDIYVDPDHRGKGMAQAMINALVAIGRDKGWFKIFWMTQHDNTVAQRLYDKIAKRKSYIRYDLDLAAREPGR